MNALWQLFTCFTPLLLVGGLVLLYIRFPQTGGASVAEIRRGAQRYRKRFPHAKLPELREALRSRYLPPPPQETEVPTHLGCLFGLAGLLGAYLGLAAGRWLKEQRHHYQTGQAQRRIKRVLAEIRRQGP